MPDHSPKIGMLLPFGPGLVSSPLLREFASILEAEGVESVWAVEHVVVADAYEPNYPYSADGRMPSAPGVVPMPDPLEVLAHLAATTYQLGSGPASSSPRRIAPPPSPNAPRRSTCCRAAGCCSGSESAGSARSTRLSASRSRDAVSAWMNASAR